MIESNQAIQSEALVHWVRDARARSCELVADLTDEDLSGHKLPILNPMLWEIGHVAWFHEKWILRHACGRDPILPEADTIYDSIAIAHDTRWGLPLLSREETLQYMRDVQDRVLDRLIQGEPDARLRYLVMLAVFHEDMHTEAFTYMRQTLGFRPPQLTEASPQNAVSISQPSSRPGRCGNHIEAGSENARQSPSVRDTGAVNEEFTHRDIEIRGGTFLLGSSPDEPFVFDNEKWAHPVEVPAFAISNTAVTQREFAEFVDDGGYRLQNLWSDDGWKWRSGAAADHPVYWRRAGESDWQRRDFDRWVPLEPNRPVVHVNWFEAEAYCNWSTRRLPTEAQWEWAASIRGDADGTVGASSKSAFPWGENLPTPRRANLDWAALGAVDVDDFSAGDSALGLRQMVGNVWEWTASTFLPYPGFSPDAYKEFSQPWFHSRKVVRGGSWATRSRIVRNTLRNFYEPCRRDIFVGFRTCPINV